VDAFTDAVLAVPTATHPARSPTIIISRFAPYELGDLVLEGVDLRLDDQRGEVIVELEVGS